MSISNMNETEPNDPRDRVEMMRNRVKESETFHMTHKPRMEVKANVPYTVLLSKDWYLTPTDDEDGWIMREESREYEDPQTHEKKMISDTTYKVRQINSVDQNFLQELHLGANAAKVFNKKILDAAVQDPDRDLLIQFTKNQGENKFKVEWDVEVKLA
jgi:hypothetical protein